MIDTMGTSGGSLGTIEPPERSTAEHAYVQEESWEQIRDCIERRKKKEGKCEDEFF